MAQARRRRFGVSLRAETAESLDELSRLLGTSRSTLVEEAVERLLEDYLHYRERHRCSGLLIVYSEDEPLDVRRVLEENRDIVLSSSHVHVGRACAEIIVVHGDSERIRRLHNSLESLGCRVRFIPLHGA